MLKTRLSSTLSILRKNLPTREYSSFHFPSLLTSENSSCWSPEEAKESITRATTTLPRPSTQSYRDIHGSKRPDTLNTRIIHRFSEEPAPSPSFLTAAFTAAANLAHHADTHYMHTQLEEQHVASTHVGYSAQDAYNVARQLKSRVKNLTEDDDVLMPAGAYRAYLRVLVATRRGDEAKDTLEEMRRNGYLPSVDTYRLVMNAVARDGTVEDAVKSIQEAIDSLSASRSQSPTALQTAVYMAIGAECAKLSLLSLFFAPHPAIAAIVSTCLFATAYATSKEAQKFFQHSPILGPNEYIPETELENSETSQSGDYLYNKTDLEEDLYGRLLLVLAREHRFQCTYDALCYMRNNNIKINRWSSSSLTRYLHDASSIPEARALLDHLRLV